LIPDSTWMNERVKQLLRIVLPLAAAYVVIDSDTALIALAKARPGIVPVSIFALLGGLLVPYVRHWMIVSLCFGIALLAVKDSFWTNGPVHGFDSIWVARGYKVAWGLLALFAAAAAVGEAVKPDSILARRCYFAVAALYFGGHGVTGFLKKPSWESLILVVTGIVAVAGAIFADRIVSSEEENQPEDEDVLAHRERVARRTAALASREWRDPTENVTHPR
jgi:hypothetical protein